MLSFLLKLLCLLVGYRFHDFLYPRLRLPYPQPNLNAKEIREKARASAAVAGIFLAFLLALLAALAAADKDVLSSVMPATWEVLITGLLGTLLPYLALREQRKISAARWESVAWQSTNRKSDVEREKKEHNLRIGHRALLVAWFVLYIAIFFIPAWQAILSRALTLSGLLLGAGSLLFLVLSVELYDTAGGWQRLNNVPYHFHMASLASHCYLLGLSMALVGFSLLLCSAHLRTGYWLSVVILGVLIAMTEIERELYNLAP